MLNLNLEKLVFLEMTNKEMAQLPNQDYFETYKLLSEKEKEYFGALSRQIHNIWTELNTQSIPNVHVKVADTIIEYNDNIEPIDTLILKCHSDYGITLKSTMNDKFKVALIKFFGKDFYYKHFE
jgi:hypothetical protein